MAQGRLTAQALKRHEEEEEYKERKRLKTQQLRELQEVEEQSELSKYWEQERVKEERKEAERKEKERERVNRQRLQQLAVLSQLQLQLVEQRKEEEGRERERKRFRQEQLRKQRQRAAEKEMEAKNIKRALKASERSYELERSRGQPAVPAGGTDATGQCVVCQEQQATMAVVDCGHLALCKSCSDEIMKSTRQCPLCRARIGSPQRLLRIYRA